METAELIALIEPLARQFFGEPNRAQSSKYELRFGSQGSKSIDLKKGVWFDHETNEGGGVIDLIRRQMGLHSEQEAYEWLEQNGKIKPNGRGRKPHPGNWRKPEPPLGDLVATYDYKDETETLLFQVLKYFDKATGNKTFRQRRPDPHFPGQWLWSLGEVRRVPYKLSDLLQHIEEHMVVVCEGERDVETCWQHNIPASCNHGGAGNWKPELNQYFHGADVVIIADNDPQSTNTAGELLFHQDGRPKFTGFDHANEVAAELSKVASKVRMLDLGKHWPECPSKGDITDWFETGHTIEQLYEIIEQLPDWDETQAKREPVNGKGDQGQTLPPILSK